MLKLFLVFYFFETIAENDININTKILLYRPMRYKQGTGAESYTAQGTDTKLQIVLKI